MLRECGLDLGVQCDRLNESYLFRRISNRSLRAAGATWSRPGPYLERRDDASFQSAQVQAARRSLALRFGRDFLGIGRWLGAGPVPVCWGWKDPRTCLTHRVWEEVFPTARWLHILRHPYDVARSLQTRVGVAGKATAAAPEVDDLRYGLALWDTYVSDALSLRALADRYLEVRYEDVVREPEPALRRICAFAGLSPAEPTLAAAAATADASRARADGDTAEPWGTVIAELPTAAVVGYR
jgi:hypothetical protein